MPVQVEVDVARGNWPATDWPALATRAVTAALAAAAPDLTGQAFLLEVSVRFTDDAEVRDLNNRFRHKDSATNVLSFSMVQPDLIAGLANSDDGEVLLGDIVLAAETVTREAADKGIDVSAHVVHLLVHGTLHLLGHDHDDDAAGERMEDIERSVLGQLGLPDPYG